MNVVKDYRYASLNDRDMFWETRRKGISALYERTV